MVLLSSERNLNPKAACLKRREEEKADDMPGRPMNVNAEDLQQSNMGPKVGLNASMEGLVQNYCHLLCKSLLQMLAACFVLLTHNITMDFLIIAYGLEKKKTIFI